MINKIRLRLYKLSSLSLQKAATINAKMVYYTDLFFFKKETFRIHSQFQGIYLEKDILAFLSIFKQKHTKHSNENK